MDAQKLMDIARKVAEKAYAPYSCFRVGAAMEMADGKIITGVNVENRSFGLSNCAERSALYAALSKGKRKILAIAVAGLDTREPLPPCGACRQVISEFCQPDMPVFYDDGKGGYIQSSVAELYPYDSLHHLGN